MNVYICFPDGKAKVLTMSYDDGRLYDRKLVDIFNKYGIKGTFNLNGGAMNRPERIPENEVKELYQGHEVATHTYNHPTIARCPAVQIYREIIEDRKKLESLVGYLVRGHAYPNGSYNDQVKQIFSDCGIDDGNMKTGSLVTSFVNAYYQRTGTPVVGMSASKGGSSILQWQPGTPFMRDVERRLSSARQYLAENHIPVRHTFLTWCQGETDGDHQMQGEEYIRCFGQFWNHMWELGVEQCFLIRIGYYNGPEAINYQEIMDAQDQFPQRMDGVTMVSTEFAGMKERGLMKDAFHYYQVAYNEVGSAAGERAGELVGRLYGINGQNEAKTAEKKLENPDQRT